MSISEILARVAAGDRVAICRDDYGNTWIELTRGWLLGKTVKIAMTRSEIEHVKQAVRAGGRRHRLHKAA